MFKNITIYQIMEPMDAVLANLEASLAEFPFKACNHQQLSSVGWIKPLDAEESLVFSHEGAYLIKLQKEEKLIPGAVVTRLVKERIDSIEHNEGRKVYRKEKLQLKDEIALDLLPRAFSKHSTTQAMILPAAGLVLVDSSNFRKAVELLTLLRNSTGSAPVKLVDVVHAPSAIMSQWITQEAEKPKEFTIGDSCSLVSTDGNNERATFKNMSLQSEEVEAHLAQGMQIEKLALSTDSFSFTLDRNLALRQLKPSEEFIADTIDGSDDPVIHMQSDLFLYSKAFEQLIKSIIASFGGLHA